MRLLPPLAAFALLAAAAAPVAAQTTPQAAPQVAPLATPSAQAPGRHQGHSKRAYVSLDQRFVAANTTHDGHLTRDQAGAAELMHTVSENFDTIDKSHKGFITEDDIRGWYKERRDARKHATEQAGSKS